MQQIANKIFSSKEVVRQNLLKFKIPLRKQHTSNGNPSQVKFGEKKIKGVVIQNLIEVRVIEAINEMYKQGMGLRAISNFLSKIGVPTKRKGKKWHPEMVKRIIGNNEKSNVKQNYN